MQHGWDLTVVPVLTVMGIIPALTILTVVTIMGIILPLTIIRIVTVAAVVRVAGRRVGLGRLTAIRNRFWR